MEALLQKIVHPYLQEKLTGFQEEQNIYQHFCNEWVMIMMNSECVTGYVFFHLEFFIVYLGTAAI